MPPSPDVIYWSDQCSAARNVPLPVLLTRVAASAFIAVSMFAITGAFSLLVLISWLRLPQHDRHKLWKHIGSFSCLLVVSCCVGVPMFVASYIYQTAFDTADLSSNVSSSAAIPPHIYVLTGENARWQAAYRVLHAASLWIDMAAKLLVLHRVVATTTATTPRLRPHRNTIVSILRFITIAIITINTAGIAAAAGSAYWLSESSQASFAAAIEAQSQTASSPVLQQLTEKTLKDYDRSRRFDSAQYICEVTTLFIVVAAFTSILPFVLRLLMLIAAQARPSQQDIASAHIAAESQAAADDASKRLRRRLLTTFIVLQLTFVLRWVHSVIDTYASLNFDYSQACGSYPDGQCLPCQPLPVLVFYWLRFTPEFSHFIHALASPLALLVALWGMLSLHDRRILFAGFPCASILAGSQPLQTPKSSVNVEMPADHRAFSRQAAFTADQA